MLLDERMEQALPFRLAGVGKHDGRHLGAVSTSLELRQEPAAQGCDILVQGEQLRDFIGRGFVTTHPQEIFNQ
jgi:hypothetical protein